MRRKNANVGISKKKRVTLLYQETLDRFEGIVRNRAIDQTMLALIIDSPWLPGYAGIDTLDFYFDTECWLTAHQKALDDLPNVAFIPGPWVEFGMAAEPSAFGAPIKWNKSSPPDVQPFPGTLEQLLQLDVPDPEKDGLMPVILGLHQKLRPKLEAMGFAPRIVAARGPLTIASHLLGLTDFLMITKSQPEKCKSLLQKTTDLCIRWLFAQLKTMDNPLGILLLDDIVGMISPSDVQQLAAPFLKKIFDSFPDLIHIYHNDTTNPDIMPDLSDIGIDLYNFSHEIPLEKARELLGPDIVLMGNLPPLELLVRGSVEKVRQETKKILRKIPDIGPALISAGGGVSPGTPIENLQAMAEAVRVHKINPF
jgi:uroporphyrinogen decarboxylase